MAENTKPGESRPERFNQTSGKNPRVLQGSDQFAEEPTFWSYDTDHGPNRVPHEGKQEGDFASWSRQALNAKAAELGIAEIDKMSHTQLVEAIRDAVRMNQYPSEPRAPRVVANPDEETFERLEGLDS